jgi:ribosomal protein L19E
VDHNHKTGQIRGLLCARCNTGLARFMDNIQVLRKAVKYMKADGEKVNKILGRKT